MSLDSPESALATTERSLRLLETIQRRDGATMTELAEERSLAVSTVYKHLATLESNGYLRKDGETYRIGFRFLNLGEHARSGLPGHQAIDDAVRRLAEETTEEVDFVVEDNGRIITVSESFHKWVKYADGDSGGYRARTGTYYPIHSTASGKAILARRSREQVDAIIDTHGLEALTDHTITERDELLAEFERTRERGFALGDEEYTDGLRSVGMVVDDVDGTPIGAMSVSGPSYRVTGSVFRERIPETLRDVVEELEARIAAESG